MKISEIPHSKFLITSYSDVKLNFWAIPKCANTSVKTSLLGKKNKNPYKEQKWVHKPWNNPYITAAEALSNNYENFTVTRHPYERFKSLYKHFGLKEPFVELNVNPNTISFDDFLNFVINNFKDDLTCNYHARSQVSFISYDNKELLLDNCIDVNNLESFLIKKSKKLIKANKSKEQEIELSEEQKVKIYNRYREDFIILGYRR